MSIILNFESKIKIIFLQRSRSYATQNFGIMSAQINWSLYYPSLPTPLGVLYILILLFILVANFLVIITFKRMRNLQIQHYFMMGLCAADLITALNPCVSASILFSGRVWLTDGLCNVLGLLLSVTLEITVLLHCALFIEKCISVRMPLWHRKVSQSANRTLLIGGTLSTCFLMPTCVTTFLAFYDLSIFEFYPDITTCFMSLNSNWVPGILTIMLFCFFPLIIQVTSSVLIVQTIRSMRAATKKRTIRAARTLATTVGLFYICWMPSIVILVWEISTLDYGVPDWFQFFAYQIITVNSGMSVIIYSLTLPGFSLRPFLNKIHPALRRSAGDEPNNANGES